MQSPPTRTNLAVRVGGLCIMSHDFNRRRSTDSKLGYLIAKMSIESSIEIVLLRAIAGTT
jgi:hypothetical protein